MMHGKHMLGHWSSTQSSVALSSGEAELNALVKAMSESLGVLNMMAQMNHIITCEVSTDSSAARGIVLRLGAGKVKHLEARQLWVQDVVARKTIKVRKKSGGET